MKISLSPKQDDFLFNDKKFVMFGGGIGAGKTFCGAHYIIKRVLEYPKSLHFIGANTAAQLRNSTLAGMFSCLNDCGISFSYNQNKGLLEFAGGKVLCASLENFNALRGIEIASFWIDEARDLREEAFLVLVGRLRDKHCDKHQGRLTTSLAGFNWLFDYFHPNGERHTKEFALVISSSQDNKHLPDGYIDTLKAQYDEKFYEQEVEAKFVNLTSGKVYYAFDRERNVKEFNNFPKNMAYLGLDFNVDPMTATICHVYNDVLYVVDEVFLRNSDTFQMAHELKSRGYTGCRVIPDSTAINRKTSGMSDHMILKQAGFNMISTHNPMVFDRVNNINRLLSQGKIIINPNCKKLINDLEKVTWKDNKLDQKTDKLLTHISDSLGYAAWKLMPINNYKNYKVSVSQR